ncbi:MAG: type II toxin-antitoxin system RelE/ParE family toxin [Bryobacteraceae bacterium]
MRVFQNKAFNRFAKKFSVSDDLLCQAIRDAEQGLIAANLGGGVIKQRIARSGMGKSGGLRAIIVFRAGARAIFIHGFAKNDKDNIDKHELVALKKLAIELLACDHKAIARLVASQTLTEMTCNEKAIS